MSLNRVEIFNWQSIKHADLDLGTFTVIVGPSSSGKSALIRAFKALASNVRGSGIITRGQKAMAITARTDTHVITLERNERSGSYKITDESGTEVFTKLAGEVPPQVTRALRIDPVTEGGSVNFASQFDKPYLLDESGATVARVLGELTNVTAIFQAVRAANRIRTNAASTLRTRKNDLEQVKTRLAAFRGLSDRENALAEAEQLDKARHDIERWISRLETHVRTIRIVERAMAKTAVLDVPDSAPLSAALDRYLDLEGKLRSEEAKAVRLHSLENQVTMAERAVDTLQEELSAVLAKAGVCPTCGQPVH